jgi:hypothetical protein
METSCPGWFLEVLIYYYYLLLLLLLLLCHKNHVKLQQELLALL